VVDFRGHSVEQLRELVAGLETEKLQGFADEFNEQVEPRHVTPVDVVSHLLNSGLAGMDVHYMDIVDMA